MLRNSVLAVLSVCALAWLAGCGDTFRPVAIPITQPGGDPSLTKHAVVLENNGGGIGGTDNYDVSGDTNIGSNSTGRDASYMCLTPNNSRVVIANRADNTLTLFATQLPTAGGTTVTLPAGSAPSFVSTADNSFVFVAEPGTSKIASVSLNNGVLSSEIGLPSPPVMFTELPDLSKLYAVLADGSVQVITPSDFSVPPAPLAGISGALWAVSAADGGRVYVVTSAPSLVVVNPTSDGIITTIPLGNSPDGGPANIPHNGVYFDPHFKRLYVTNFASGTVSIIDGSTTVATLLTTVPVGSGPDAVTALADGSRAYVANYNDGTVSVINTTSNTVTKTITVGTHPVGIASSSDSSRVYIANFDTSGSPAGTISDINTSSDTVNINFRPTVANPIQVLINQ